MSALVPFRNRIAHHETIIFRPIQVHYDELIKLARWIDPAAVEWIAGAARLHRRALHLRHREHRFPDLRLRRPPRGLQLRGRGQARSRTRATSRR